MTTNAPRAYADSTASAPPAYPALDGGEGGSEAPPPAFNPSAPSAPYTPPSAGSPGAVAPTIQYNINNSINVSPQQPQQPPVQVVQQQPTIQYVQQQPPVQVVQQQPKVVYVQQQPVPRTVTYVNQFGQPIAAPTAAPPVQQVTYVTAQPPTAGQTAMQPVKNNQPVGSWRNPTPSQRNGRAVAMIAGLLAAILLFIAMCIGEMASSDVNGVEYTSTFYQLEATYDAFDIDYEWNYSTECYDYDSWDSTTSGYAEDWCDTQQAANWFIALTVFSFLFVLPGLLIVQTCCFMERCCCGSALPKV
eukprot:252994_1